jgi:hypothetical protein
MGGGGSSYTNWKTKDLTGAVRKESDKASTEFELELAGLLSDLLASCNSRDVDLVHDRLDAAKEALQNELENTIDQLFGGSVAKHTYVDGLSDIDSLLVLKDEELRNKLPRQILAWMEDVLVDRLPAEIKISHGDMALTLEYPDGMSIQLLPAFETPGGLRVPASGQNTWSDIDPEGFSRALTSRNEECGGKLVPTVKLAKAALANLPEQYRLSGYHVESLGIAAFAKYEGTKTTGAMLPYFFDRAKDLVLTPIRDRTGQSVHVDEYLGGENSEARKNVSHLLTRLAKRMRTASAAKSKAQWQALFFTED